MAAQIVPVSHGQGSIVRVWRSGEVPPQDGVVTPVECPGLLAVPRRRPRLTILTTHHRVDSLVGGEALQLQSLAHAEILLVAQAAAGRLDLRG